MEKTRDQMDRSCSDSCSHFSHIMLSISFLFVFGNFRFDCGIGEGVVRSESPVVLNSWNRVTVYRDGWTAWMTLNGGQQVSGQSKAPITDINFRLELFLGGSPNLTLVSQRTNSFTGFTGCTRKLEINGRSYDFRSDIRGDAIDGVDIGQFCIQSLFILRQQLYFESQEADCILYLIFDRGMWFRRL